MGKRKATAISADPLEPKIVARDEAEVFEEPIQQGSIKSSQMCEYGTLAAIGNEGPIEFKIEKSSKFCTDMSEVYLEVEVMVQKADGSKLNADDRNKIGPVNNFFGALFSW